MKKIFLLLCAAAALSVNATTTSVWTGNYNFPAAGDGWQEVAASEFADLALGDYLQVTVSEITNPDGWAQINLAGKDPWMSVPGTNWGDVQVGTTKYIINDSALLASIVSGGLGVQGKYYTLTDISIVSGGDTILPPPTPQGTTIVWSGEFTFNAEGSSSFPDIAGTEFALLQQGDYIQVTVSEVTNPDGWWQINLAAKDPWTSLPGTNWETFSETGNFRFQINDADLVDNIIRGGLAVQGKHMTITSIGIVSTATALPNTMRTASCTKRLVNGQLIIIRDGQSYTITGARL